MTFVTASTCSKPAFRCPTSVVAGSTTGPTERGPSRFHRSRLFGWPAAVVHDTSRETAASCSCRKCSARFVQDQINVNDRFSITPGIRYDWQNIFTDNNNVAARLSAAYALDPKTALRGGLGVFYDRAGDGPIREVLRSREDRLLRIILLNPGYPDPFGSGASGATARSIVTLDAGIQIPSTESVRCRHRAHDQQRHDRRRQLSRLARRGSVSLARHQRAAATALPGSRPIQPLDKSGRSSPPARQTAHSLQVVIERTARAATLKGSVQYTFGTAHNDTNGINSLPANNYDLASEWGRAEFRPAAPARGAAPVEGGQMGEFRASASRSCRAGRIRC